MGGYRVHEMTSSINSFVSRKGCKAYEITYFMTNIRTKFRLFLGYRVHEMAYFMTFIPYQFELNQGCKAYEMAYFVTDGAELLPTGPVVKCMK